MYVALLNNFLFNNAINTSKNTLQVSKIQISGDCGLGKPN